MSMKYRTILTTLTKGLLPETQAIIDRAVLEGFTLPSASKIRAINSLIGRMIIDGWWVKRDLILNFTYNDLNCENFSRINWKNPTGNLATFGVGHNYLLTGSQGGGIDTSFVNTQFNPTIHGITYTLNDASREAIIYAQVANAMIDGNVSFNETIRVSTSQPSRINSGNSSGGFDYFSVTDGYKAIHRTASDLVTGISKATSSTLATLSTAISNGNQTIHRGSFLNGTNTVSLYSMGASTIVEGQLLRTAYNTYLTKIGLIPIA